jgi:hypothetical protein
MKRIIIPEEKMPHYIKYCNSKEKESTVFCDICKKIVGIKQYPNFYDAEENDVYFASVCPECGEFIITKE